MPPATVLTQPLRTIAFRPRPRTNLRPTIGVKRSAITQCRAFADAAQKDAPPPPPFSEQNEKGPNMDQQEHVSEEDAKIKAVMGEAGPDIEGHGTPVQDILKDDKAAAKTAPQVMKEAIKSPQGSANSKPSSRSFSTLARRQLDMAPGTGLPSSDLDMSMLPSAEQRAAFESEFLEASTPAPTPTPTPGHKFPIPEGSIPHKDYRHEPLILQVTTLMMRDGKKATAQRNMSVILSHLRTAPAPVYSATRKLMPGAPPASHLPLHPVLYLTLAIDSIAPLLRIRSQRGAAGGGVALQIPVPLGLRQRRRTAFQWILDAASKKKSRGSGKDTFPTRVAEEVVAVVEGRSAIWEKRQAVHRLATTARSNLMGKGRR